MDDRSIKENIADLRKRLRLTQTAVADRIGISRTAYRNFENGSTRMYNENIDKVAKVLDIPVEAVVLGYGAPPHSHGPEDSQRVYGKKSGLDDVESVAELKKQNALLKEQFAEIKEQNDLLMGYVDSLREIISSKDELIALLREVRKK